MNDTQAVASAKAVSRDPLAFWEDVALRRGRNTAAFMLAAQAAVAAIDAGEDLAPLRRRFSDAIDEYEAISLAVTMQIRGALL